MEFFLPASTDEDRESVYSAIKEFATQTTGWPVKDERIFSITYVHEGKRYHDEVGKPDGRVKEVVIAILRSVTYLVCTKNRGVLRGGPIMVGLNNVEEVVYFDK
jgi:hypothetical protein